MKLVLHKNHVNKYNIYNQASGIYTSWCWYLLFYSTPRNNSPLSNFNCPTKSTTKQDIQSYSWTSMSITSGYWQPPKSDFLSKTPKFPQSKPCRLNLSSTTTSCNTATTFGGWWFCNFPLFLLWPHSFNWPLEAWSNLCVSYMTVVCYSKKKTKNF